MKKVVAHISTLLLIVITTTTYGGISTYNSGPVAITTYYPFSSTKQVITLQDDQYHYMHNNPPSGYPYINQSITDYLSLQFTGAQTELYSAFTLTVNYEVDAWDITSTALGPFTGSLTISYDPLSKTIEEYRDENKFPSGDSIIVKITGITYSNPSGLNPSIPQDVELTSRITVNRYWTFNQNLAPVSTYTVNAANNTLNLEWNYVQGAETYDVEWLFVSSYANQSLPPDFTQATRINTTEQTYAINLAYDVGTIYWRMRGVGPMEPGTAEVRDGEWSSTGSIPVSDVDVQRNWTYSSAYAEEGKKKEVLSFFDGSTRQRQSVTENNTSNVGLISETMYDYEGRSAVTTLAAPDNADDSKLAFYTDLNMNTASTPAPYSRKDFDVELTSSCPSPPSFYGMAASQGSGNYYSNNNPLLSYGLNAPIPDAGYGPSNYTPAGTYPFTETYYDLEGRVAEQAGPGTTLSEGGGHTTKYLYATPLSANIYKLFGSYESGDPSHYQEKAVVDPNGQVSVSYLDMSGKVVATSITGPGPANMHNVVEPPNSQYQLYTSVLTTPSSNTFNPSDDAMELNQEYMNLASGTSAFTYTLDPGQLSTCLPKTFTVLYDLVIYITDPCGNLMILSPGTLPAGVTAIPSISPTQIVGTQVAAGTSFTFTASLNEIGVYHIVKKLYVDGEGLAMAVKCFDDSLQGGCPFTTLAQYTALFSDSVNTNNSCLSCTQLCLSDANQKYPHGTPTQISNYVDSCSEAMQCGEPEYINPCQGLLGILKNDMSPGGQYFDNRKANAPANQPANDNWLITYVGTNAAGLYAWASASSNNCPPTGLTATSSWDDVRANWQPCFANYLVQKHPEYCRYQECLGLSSPAPDTNPYNPNGVPVNSDQFDEQIAQNNTLAWAQNFPTAATAYIYNLSLYPSGGPYWTNMLNDDPFFGASGPGHSYKTTMSGEMSTPTYFSYVSGDLWAYANSLATAAGYSINSDKAWQIFVGLYETLKNTYVESWEAAQGCSSFCDSGAISFNPPQNDDIAMATVAGNGCSTPAAGDGFLIRDDDPTVSLTNYAVNYVNNHSSPPTITYPTCCNVAATALFQGPITCIGTGNMFLGGGVYDTAYVHMWVNGQDITCTGALIQNLPVSVATLYYEISLAINNCNSGYTATFNPMGPSLTITGLCEKGDTLNGYVAKMTGDATCTTLPAGQYEAETFQAGSNVACGTPNFPPPNCLCIELAQLQALYDTNVVHFSNGTLPNIDPSAETFEEFAVCNLDSAYSLGSDYLNGSTIDTWISNCNSDTNTSPTNHSCCPAVPTALNCNPQSTCAEDAYTIANQDAEDAYNSELQLTNENFTSAYLAAAFSASDGYSEYMSIANNSYETHYTLYYYDLAGNLTRTVPPAGVQVLSPTVVFDIETTHSVVPTTHTKITYYQYNTLNELVGETTPDAGFTYHYYDVAGRLRFTQNAQQASTSPATYSYTRYDQQGRVIEVGQSSVLTYGSHSYQYGANDETFPAPPYTSQVTQTYYDQVFPGSTSSLQAEFDNGGQENLRSRVATVTYSATGYAYASGTTYDYATHYSYDEHGNVNNLVQDNPALGIFVESGSQEYKKMRYMYDLVSGNVNMVDYQPGYIDQYLHRYEYDADNRLTNAYTSVDSIIWDQDAKYFYYLHGPLARTEIGQDKVQGTDYAYTIEGWLKGVNSNLLSTSTDIGQDGIASSYQPGQPNIHENIAEDAYGFTLNYFRGGGTSTYYNDYTSIASSGPATTFYNNSLANATGEDLFNGNIKQMAVAMTNTSNAKMNLMDYHYRYDQLNRLDTSLPYIASASATSYSGAVPTNTNPALADYATQYSYDQDGNILRLLRNSVTGSGINNLDTLSFHYVSATKNWLSYVADDKTGAISQVAAAGDIQPGQSPGNYTYDNIGELTSDAQSQIGTITWNVYGKVLSVVRTSGSTQSDLYFYYDALGNRICKLEKPRSSGGEMTQDHWIYTYYVRDASGNIMGIYTRNFVTLPPPGYMEYEQVKLNENPIYSSKRIGDNYRNQFVSAISYTSSGYNSDGTVIFTTSFIGLVHSGTSLAPPQLGPDYNRTIGNKSYELTDHLGNVLETVSDRKLPNGTVNNAVSYFSADIITNSDYYPFGQVEPSRNGVYSSNYRFGYNGMEQDPEIKADNNSYTTQYRMYDPRLARWGSPDPLAYPWESSYNGFANSPIMLSDPLGLYATEAEARRQRSKAVKAGYDPGPVYQTKPGAPNSWGFNTRSGDEIIGNFSTEFPDVASPSAFSGSLQFPEPASSAAKKLYEVPMWAKNFTSIVKFIGYIPGPSDGKTLYDGMMSIVDNKLSKAPNPGDLIGIKGADWIEYAEALPFDEYTDNIDATEYNLFLHELSNTTNYDQFVTLANENNSKPDIGTWNEKTIIVIYTDLDVKQGAVFYSPLGQPIVPSVDVIPKCFFGFEDFYKGWQPKYAVWGILGEYNGQVMRVRGVVPINYDKQ